MPRRARTSSDIVTRFQQEEGHAAGGSTKKRRRWGTNSPDFMDRLSKICNLFCAGNTAAQICRQLLERYEIKMNREEPYQYIAYAARQGWIRYAPPLDHALASEFKECCPWLRDTRVVTSGVFGDVAHLAAEMLANLIHEHSQPPYSKDEVHVGFAGGHAMRRVAKAFAQLLRDPPMQLPRTVVFHAMVAGFDVQNPSTDPNAFFTYFCNDPAIQTETRFVGLHAPALVTSDQFKDLREMQGIREAYQARDQLDIIMTSGALWSDDDSMLLRYMKRSENSYSALQEAGCVGDMLWRPLAADGPIETETPIRAMTLMELTDMPDFINKGGHVLLVLGPCGGCGALKTELVKRLLRIQPALITHLALDSQTARGAAASLIPTRQTAFGPGLRGRYVTRS
jgi:putative sugar-binding domain-containing protein